VGFRRSLESSRFGGGSGPIHVNRPRLPFGASPWQSTRARNRIAARALSRSRGKGTHICRVGSLHCPSCGSASLRRLGRSRRALVARIVEPALSSSPTALRTVAPKIATFLGRIHDVPQMPKTTVSSGGRTSHSPRITAPTGPAVLHLFRTGQSPRNSAAADEPTNGERRPKSRFDR
jgi:hypothetical protein